VLHVIDTGPGMTPEVLEKVFTPYFTTKSGGTGLGLPTTRRLIEAHGGRIDVHTEVGRGTDFVVRLPV
jgi:signal transduction histidine kinase